MKKLLIIVGVLYSTSLFALSPEVRFDMLTTKLVQQLKTQEYAAALDTMSEVRALGVAVPDSFNYFEGKALFESGKKYESYKVLEKYVDTNGKDAKYYKQAIAYLVKAEDAYKAQHEREMALLKEVEEFKTLHAVFSPTDTGLVWTMPVAKKYRNNPYLPVKVAGTKQGAQDYCENLTLEGSEDWRIPTLKEFSTISNEDWGEKNYYSVWVQGSKEFSTKNEKFDAYQMYPIINGENSSSGKEVSGVMCVHRESQEQYEEYFNQKYRLIELKGHKVFMEDRYMISNDKCYFVDPDVNFDRAVDYCKSLELCGYDDWRLPTKKDMLNKLPCKIANKLHFLRNDASYTDLWFGSKSFGFKSDIGYLDSGECKIREAKASSRHKVRCVRDAE